MDGEKKSRATVKVCLGQGLMIDYIQTKGLETVSVEKLIQEITPHARGKKEFIKD